MRVRSATRMSRGSGLALVMVSTLVAGLLGVALVDRSIRSSRTAAWGREHLVARMLAGSVADATYLDLQEMANIPGSSLYEALRQGGVGTAGAPSVPVAMTLPAIITPVVEEQAKVLGATITPSLAVSLRGLSTPHFDPEGRIGVVVVDVVIEVTGRPLAVTERLTVERAVRVSKVTAPFPLDQVGLLVMKTSKRDLARFKGKPALATTSRAPRTLLELMTTEGADGLQILPVEARKQVGNALRRVEAAALRTKAHFVVKSGQELDALIRPLLAQGKAVHGVVHVDSRGPEDVTRLELPVFRGRCLISVTGPVVVGDIRLEDPARDSLTIVSQDRVLVIGREVHASIVALSKEKGGLAFQQRAVIRGSLICQTFPAAVGLSSDEFGGCQFGGSAVAAVAASSHVAILAPHPLAIRTNQEGEE